MSTKEQYWKYSLIAIIIGLGIILFRQIAPFMGGLLGALTIYILVRKQMMYLSDKRKMKRSIAATLITAEAILCFLVPLGLVVWLAVVNLQNINLDPQAIIAPFEEAANIIKAKTGYYILGKTRWHTSFQFFPASGKPSWRYQQFCRQHLRTGLCTLLHADRGKRWNSTSTTYCRSTMTIHKTSSTKST